VNLFVKVHKIYINGEEFAFKTMPTWLMRLLLLTGKYQKVRITKKNWVILRKFKEDE
jgi:hypothetical protein